MTHPRFTLPSLRRGGAALCLALALPAAAAAQQPSLPPAEEVVARYVEAVGGRDALLKHSSRTLETEMQMGPVRLTMRMVMAAPNRVVNTIEMPGMGAIRSGYDGTVAWQASPMSGPALVEGGAREQAAENAEFHAPLRYDKLFRSMETVERTEMNGRPCFRLKLVSHSGRESWQCFDTETGLAVAAGGPQETQMGTMDVTALLSDYREFDGVLMATRTTSTMMGQPVVMTLKSVSHAPVDASVFALPPEIQALVAARKK